MSGWRTHTDGSPVHVWPDWMYDRQHNLEGSDSCWCSPRIEIVPRPGRVSGIMLVHRPTWRQRLHLWPTAARAKIGRWLVEQQHV